MILEVCSASLSELSLIFNLLTSTSFDSTPRCAEKALIISSLFACRDLRRRSAVIGTDDPGGPTVGRVGGAEFPAGVGPFSLPDSSCVISTSMTGVGAGCCPGASIWSVPVPVSLDCVSVAFGVLCMLALTFFSFFRSPAVLVLLLLVILDFGGEGDGVCQMVSGLDIRGPDPNGPLHPLPEEGDLSLLGFSNPCSRSPRVRIVVTVPVPEPTVFPSCPRLLGSTPVGSGPQRG